MQEGPFEFHPTPDNKNERPLTVAVKDALVEQLGVVGIDSTVEWDDTEKTYIVHLEHFSNQQTLPDRVTKVLSSIRESHGDNFEFDYDAQALQTIVITPLT